ncbi:hypothetical protein [Halarcobacter sp.]|uniref:hypothetical protein n=1 Tax=Halarcobacter sp. TaxID=2321133 RepID=UPI002AA78172|nr:hypothetical protein [Halarcobacter sp.]
MRGSVYYQTSILAKVIFVEGAKKIDRINPDHNHFNCIASYKSMETYRRVWNNLFNYLREHWKLKNCELITYEHVEAYYLYKIEYYPAKQYAEKIVSAMVKLEFTLNKYSKQKYDNPILYDFSKLKRLLSASKKIKFVSDIKKSRAYINPYRIIENLEYYNHQLAALMQLEGGARSEGVTLINRSQLKGINIDDITKKEIGVIETKEKGGKVGDIAVSIKTYGLLEQYFIDKNVNSFRIKYQKYANDIRQACLMSKESENGSHGFRWAFCRRRVREYQQCGYSYEQAMQGVSWEMKHYRASITEHYLS